MSIGRSEYKKNEEKRNLLHTERLIPLQILISFDLLATISDLFRLIYNVQRSFSKFHQDKSKTETLVFVATDRQT